MICYQHLCPSCLYHTHLSAGDLERVPEVDPVHHLVTAWRCERPVVAEVRPRDYGGDQVINLRACTENVPEGDYLH